MDELERDTLWCLRLFTLMALGGIWGVPANGMVFRKDSLDPPTLVLIEQGEGTEGEFELYVERFARAGITVSR